MPKIVATRAYGATVHLTGSTIDDALLAATEFAAETGAVLIHPFDHRDVVAGQATVGLEILEQLPEVGTIVVPAGGGGLVAGVAAVVKAARPEVRIVAVQAAGAAAWPVSLKAGHPVALESMDTMADGIAVGKPGAVPLSTWPPWSTTWSRSARKRCRGACCCAWSAPSWWWNLPAPPR